VPAEHVRSFFSDRLVNFELDSIVTRLRPELTRCLRAIVTPSIASAPSRRSHGHSAPPAIAVMWLLLLCCACTVLTTAAGCRTEPVANAAAEQQIPPPDAPRELKTLIGEYGAANDWLTVYEADGQLYADGLGLNRARLRPVAASRFITIAPPTRQVNFEPNGGGQGVAVEVDGKRLAQRDVGQEVIERIRSGVAANPQQLRQAALAAVPPSEPPPKRPANLVDLSSMDQGIKLDIRYASSNNFMGFPLYEQAAAYMQRPAAEALGRVAHSLARRGYGLLIHDAYRPWFVTKMFWDATPPASHIYVADPSQASRHNRGCAVDLTLYELKSGEPVEMTGRYDEMSRRSFADYVGGTSRQRWFRDLLRTSMESEGFAVYPQEWWHFDYKDWGDYGIGNRTFAELQRP